MLLLSEQGSNTLAGVTKQLREDYPNRALDWLSEANWTSPQLVPLDKIEYDDNIFTRVREHEQDKVAQFAKRIKGGWRKPCILIRRPSGLLKPVDGHTRIVAYHKLRRPCLAWVGTVRTQKGPWDGFHKQQLQTAGMWEQVLEFPITVRTAAGEAFYHQPIGSVVYADGPGSRWMDADTPEILESHSHQDLLDVRREVQEKYDRTHPLVKKVRAAVVASRKAGRVAGDNEPKPTISGQAAATTDIDKVRADGEAAKQLLSDQAQKAMQGAGLIPKPVSAPRDSLEANENNPARKALRDKIVNDAIGNAQPSEHPVATFLGGGPASGKGTAIGPQEGSVHIDADEIKQQLPEYQQMLDAGDRNAAAYVHEESSMLSKRIAAEAAQRKLDYTLDGTGDSSYDKMAGKVMTAKANGHTAIAKYVTVDPDTAVERAMKRAQRTGRMVPESVIRETHADVSRVFKQAIDNDLFDSAELWDNNGTEPKLVGSKPLGGKWTVHDPEAWRAFLAKGGIEPDEAPVEGESLWQSRNGVVNVSPSELEVIHGVWYSEQADTTNRMLRNGRDETVSYLMKEELFDRKNAEAIVPSSSDIDEFDRIIARAVLSQPIRLQRGVNDPAEIFGPVGSMVGKDFTDKGYVATSAVKTGEQPSFLPHEGHKTAIIAISLPAGATALKAQGDFYIEDEGLEDLESDPKSSYNFFKEYVLPRNGTYHIVSDRLVNGKRQLEMTWGSASTSAPLAGGAQ